MRENADISIFDQSSGDRKVYYKTTTNGERKDDYDSENSWISDGLPSSSRRRRRGGGRWEVREWREK